MMRFMNWTSTAVIRKQKQWTVQVESSAGEAAELTYASEAQARYFAAVLEMRPSMLPKAAIVRRLADLPAPRPSSPRHARK
jgi:hypothetical protein